MTDRNACIWNLIDGYLQREEHDKGTIPLDAIEKALYKAYDMGARDRNPNYAEMSSILRNLSSTVSPISNIDGSLYCDIKDLIDELEDELDKVTEESTNKPYNIANDDTYNIFW